MQYLKFEELKPGEFYAVIADRTYWPNEKYIFQFLKGSDLYRTNSVANIRITHDKLQDYNPPGVYSDLNTNSNSSFIHYRKATRYEINLLLKCVEKGKILNEKEIASISVSQSHHFSTY